jgi:hypothetical protein
MMHESSWAFFAGVCSLWIISFSFTSVALLSGQVIEQQRQLTLKPAPDLERIHRVGHKFDLAVTVYDERGREVPDATVTFQMPGDGASATSLNGRLVTIQSDPNGVAKAVGLRANSTGGDYDIRVNANFEGKAGYTTIRQTNRNPPFAVRRRTLIAEAAAVAVIVPVLALRSSPPPKATISTVTPTGPVTHP